MLLDKGEFRRDRLVNAAIIQNKVSGFLNSRMYRDREVAPTSRM
jgi:hypothetical protein